MNLLNKILENSIKQNVLYFLGFTSSIYLSKSIYDFFRNLGQQKNRNKEIRKILDQEKHNLNLESASIINKEQIIYLYYKILFTIYNRELNEFNILRRQYFNSNNFSDYINLVKDFEIYDENILKTIYKEFDIEENTFNISSQDRLLVR